ncbi:MAG: DsbA family oxidoreductase [Actinomycetota bacterium]
MGDRRRSTQHPWLPLLLNGKVVLDAAGAVYLTIEQASRHRSEGRDIGDRDTLVSLGASVGLHPDEVRRVVDDQAYRDRIEASTRLAVEVGADGVPAWLNDGETLLTGAQPVEVFDRVLRRLGHGGRRETTRSAR